jgi:hypothetical protein
MSHRFVRRAVTAAVLAASLALAAPAHAAGLRGPDPASFFEQARQWMAKLWSGEGTTVREKRRLEIDPGGAPAPVTATSCTKCEAGAGVDPNG